MMTTGALYYCAETRHVARARIARAFAEGLAVIALDHEDYMLMATQVRWTRPPKAEEVRFEVERFIRLASDEARGPFTVIFTQEVLG